MTLVGDIGANRSLAVVRTELRQVLRRARALAAEPVKAVVLGAALASLGLLIAYPMILLVKFSLLNEAGLPSFAPLMDAFAEPGIAKAAVNTAWLGFYVTVGSLALGVPMAWLVARTDMPGKAIVRLGAVISFVIPSFITVIAWLALGSPNSGYLNALLRSLFGENAWTFNVVSFSGLVFIEIAHIYPLVFFTTAAALGNIDPSREQAARVLGAGQLRTAVSITLPLVRPAIVSGAILVLLDALSSFGAPAVIGTMANFSVLTTKIYLLLSFPPRLELAAAVSLPIVLFTFLCLALQRYLVKPSRFQTISGKGNLTYVIRLRRWRVPALLCCFAAVAVTALLPVAALLLLSLLRFFGADIVLENLTLRNFEIIANASMAVPEAIKHSVLLAIGTAFLCMVLGMLAAWFVERTSIFGRGLVTALIVLTYGFPAITFAVAMMLGYLHAFYGTFTILIIAYVAKNLPIAFVMFRSALKQIAPELEEVARVVGAGWARTLVYVTAPLLKSSGWAVLLLIFALTMRELSMSAILTQPNTEVMSTKVMEFLETGAVELAAAMAVVIVLLSIGALCLLRLMSGKSVTDI